MITIIEINRDEAEYLRELEKHGMLVHLHISHKTTHGKRFMAENLASVKALTEYRKKNIQVLENHS